MKYNFDEVFPRKGSASVKHDLMKPFFGTEDLLPMWVADMDFKAPECVLDAIRKRCDQGFLGYTFGQDIIPSRQKNGNCITFLESLSA